MHNDESTRVRAAHDAFYDALLKVCRGDPEPMMTVWHKDEAVSTAHPMGPWIHGWTQLEATWREFSRAISQADQEVTDVTVHVLGDVAYSTCCEHWTLTLGGRTVSFKSNATNIFRRDEDGWKIVHHHADKAPDFEALA